MGRERSGLICRSPAAKRAEFHWSAPTRAAKTATVIYWRRRCRNPSATLLIGATLVGAGFTGHAQAETTLNALFMAQAAYSEADVRAMTDAFAKANPDIKVNLEFVPYEGLHDKTVLAQGSGGGYDVVLFDVIWPAEYAATMFSST